jgi:3-hydroxymyristoyl/3-hydroxydecanoyl-(acyl carrier protein) dehydratase
MHIDHEKLYDYLPHRGVNLFIDSVDLDRENKSGVGKTVVPAGDPRTVLGRTLAGQTCWWEPFLAEFLALSGIPMIADRGAPGAIAVFSMISKFKRLAPVLLHEPMQADVRITRERKDFTVQTGEIIQNGEIKVTAEIMSGWAPAESVAAAEPRTDAAPDGGDEVPAPDDRNETLGFLSQYYGPDAENADLHRGSYTYPTDHLLVPGHFPAGGVMMGVTQWAAVAELAGVVAKANNWQSMTVSGGLTRPNGDRIVDVRGLQLSLVDGSVVIDSTARIAFRDLVRPGETVLPEINIEQWS